MLGAALYTENGQSFITQSFPKKLTDLNFSLQLFPDCNLHTLQFTTFQGNSVSCSAGKGREEKATVYKETKSRALAAAN